MHDLDAEMNGRFFLGRRVYPAHKSLSTNAEIPVIELGFEFQALPGVEAISIRGFQTKSIVAKVLDISFKTMVFKGFEQAFPLHRKRQLDTFVAAASFSRIMLHLCAP